MGPPPFPQHLNPLAPEAPMPDAPASDILRLLDAHHLAQLLEQSSRDAQEPVPAPTYLQTHVSLDLAERVAAEIRGGHVRNRATLLRRSLHLYFLLLDRVRQIDLNSSTARSLPERR